MGVRLYDSATGRFLSNDPVYGGNANAYVYPDDPISLSDVTGMYCWCHTFHFHIGGDTLNSEDDAAQIADTWLPRLADGTSEVPGLGGHNWVVLVHAIVTAISAAKKAWDQFHYYGAKGVTISVKIGVHGKHWYSTPKL